MKQNNSKSEKEEYFFVETEDGSIAKVKGKLVKNHPDNEKEPNK